MVVPVGVLQDVKGAARGVTPQQGRCQHLVTWACTCGLLSVHCILPAQAGNNNALITLRYKPQIVLLPDGRHCVVLAVHDVLEPKGVVQTILSCKTPSTPFPRNAGQASKQVDRSVSNAALTFRGPHFMCLPQLHLAYYWLACAR